MNIASYLLASLYSGVSPSFNVAALSCTVNGQEVACPGWAGPLMAFFPIVMLLFVAFIFVTMWIIFKKANQPGWAAIIPVYNIVVMLQIVRKPTWWVILSFVPLVNIIIGLIVMYEFAKVFGKGFGFFLGMLFLPIIFYPILAFGKSVYMPGSQAKIA
ncbi:MAG: DUF5684 domain-containing protein [Candidatus Staskawiczbacteria bacterium]|nr:DUF5684 domain-containing protein [Candidatus Staskawiczbacteria bacterium]